MDEKDEILDWVDVLNIFSIILLSLNTLVIPLPIIYVLKGKTKQTVSKDNCGKASKFLQGVVGALSKYCVY